MSDVSKLAEIEERWDFATKGPWHDAGNKIGVGERGIAEVEFDRPEDMLFVCQAWEDVAWLISEVKRLSA